MVMYVLPFKSGLVSQATRISTAKAITHIVWSKEARSWIMLIDMGNGVGSSWLREELLAKERDFRWLFH